MPVEHVAVNRVAGMHAQAYASSRFDPSIVVGNIKQFPPLQENMTAHDKRI